MRIPVVKITAQLTTQNCIQPKEIVFHRKKSNFFDTGMFVDIIRGKIPTAPKTATCKLALPKSIDSLALFVRAPL